MSYKNIRNARATRLSSLRSIRAALALPVVVCYAGLAPHAACTPVPTLPLPWIVARAQLIVIGRNLGTSGMRRTTEHLLVRRVIQGALTNTTIAVDLGISGSPLPPGTMVALLDAADGTFVPATGRIDPGQSFYPAEETAPKTGASPLEQVVAGIGAAVLDNALPFGLRQWALNTLCPLAAAAPELIAASQSRGDARIGYGAISCRIRQGDLGLLHRLAAKFASTQPPPLEVATLARAIEDVRKPAAIPALAAMALARSPRLRLAAIRALGYTLACAAIPPLRSVLLHGPPADRVAAANALTYIVPGPPRPITADEFQRSGAAITRQLLESARQPYPGCRR